MRKILLLFLAVMSLTSCATTAHFDQIATIASTQIRISDEGKFRYNNSGIDIEYNFWSEYGKFGFIVTTTLIMIFSLICHAHSSLLMG